MTKTRLTVAERFWKFVDRGDPDKCWLWKSTIWGSGYGRFGIDATHKVRAHRMAWELTNGPIPDGLWVLHNCPGGDNPRCCNPNHLWLGTRADNMRDAWKKGRVDMNKVSRAGVLAQWGHDPQDQPQPTETAA